MISVLWRCPWIPWLSVSMGALLFTAYFLLSLSHQAFKWHLPLLSHLLELVLSQDWRLWFAMLSEPSLLIPQKPGVWSQVSDFLFIFPLRVDLSLSKSNFIQVLLTLGPRCTFSVLHSLHSPLWRGLQTDSLGFICLLPIYNTLNFIVFPVFQLCCRHGSQVLSFALLVPWILQNMWKDSNSGSHHYPESIWKFLRLIFKDYFLLQNFFWFFFFNLASLIKMCWVIKRKATYSGWTQPFSNLEEELLSVFRMFAGSQDPTETLCLHILLLFCLLLSPGPPKIILS